jgi:FKBP-type peptidyl-prolyl cis-trans isomerase
VITDERFDEMKEQIIVPSSLGIEILKEGQGKGAENGDELIVNYLGFLADGTKFDSSYEKGEPFEFTFKFYAANNR